MQQTPIRLSQTIWIAFKSAKPVPRTSVTRSFSNFRSSQNTSRLQPQYPRPVLVQVRLYGDAKSDFDRDAEESKKRIDAILKARAENAEQAEEIQNGKDEPPSPSESQLHSLGQAAAYVSAAREYARAQLNNVPKIREYGKAQLQNMPNLRAQAANFMDNFQAHLFTASRRLNDLTGYTSIEALKKHIEKLESEVFATRQQVKTARANYSSAVATRSATQREVNDLLHRKHAWSASDLERFTSLYRSDHANEQAETAAQKEVQDAETKYEEVSAKLARSILSRYHEEQVWSDKIRQMSTWGTWGLMGLNVLLFIVFQIGIEPWRRARLVKGFEEKVELALADHESKMKALQPAGQTAATISASVPENAPPPDATVAGTADEIAAAIVDAVTGTTDPETVSGSGSDIPSLNDIETAVEKAAMQEMADELDSTLPVALPTSTASLDTTTPADTSNSSNLATATTTTTSSAEDLPQVKPPDSTSTSNTPPSTPLRSTASPLANLFSTSPAAGYAAYEDAFRELFSEREIVVTQKELTTVALEGVAGGAALMGLLFVLLRPK